MQQIKLKKEPLYTQKKSAFDFQIKAEDFVSAKDYAGIFYEQGLGKTKIALDVILFWLSNKVVDTVIIVTKKSLVKNWEKETRSHTFLKPRILSQNGVANSYIYNSPTRLIITHYEVINSEKERLELFCRTRSTAIILDEAAKIKNPESSVSKSLHEIRKSFCKRVIMTGTPIANRPYDIWSLIYFLDNGESLGSNFKEFKENLDLSNSLSTNDTDKDLFERSLSQLFSRIESFCIRETKEGSSLDLPKKQFYKVECDWEFYQRDMYDQVRKEQSIVLINKEGMLFDDSSTVIKRLLRLIQITSNPKLIDSNYDNEPGKQMVLENIVSQIIGKGEKCIVWTNFIDNIAFLKNVLNSYNPLALSGKMGMEERNRVVEEFLNNEEKRILIATPASSKEGLTLTVANHAIFYDRNLSLDDYLQAQDRIHRISQTKECHIYDLIMKDSIDEWIDNLLESKHYAAQLGQGDISIDEYRKNADYMYSEIMRNIIGGKENVENNT